MTSPYLMKVPFDLEAAVRLGSAYVKGAMVKDAMTNQILGHLQPTASLLTRALSTPLNAFLMPLEIASSLGQNWQLWKVRQALSTLQTIASIGTAASVLNLGVSVGGFALVLNAVKQMDGKVDRVLKALGELQDMHKGDHRAGVRTILERADGSFNLPSIDQRGRWLEIEDRAHAFCGITLSRLQNLGLSLESPVRHDGTSAADLAVPILRSDAEAGVLLTMLMHLASVRSEALLCLQRPGEAADLARTQAGWLAALPGDADATTRRLIGEDLLPRRQLRDTVEQSVALTTWTRLNHESATDRAVLCASLAQHDVDCLSYVRTVREHQEPTLLFLPYGEEAMARFGPKNAPETSADPEQRTEIAGVPVQPSEPAETKVGTMKRFARTIGAMFGRAGTP